MKLIQFICKKAEQCSDVKCPHHVPHFYKSDCIETECNREIMGHVDDANCIEYIPNWDN